VSKRYAIFLRWAVTTMIVTGLLCIAPLLDNGFRYGFWQNVGLVAGVAVFGGLVSAAILYARHMMLSMRSLRPTEGYLGRTELILKETPWGFVHHRTGRPWRFWEAVGGKLFLTSSRLIFRAHAGQFWRYELAIPLSEVADVKPCYTAHVPKGLTVVRTDGTKELFACDPWENVDEWVSALTVLRTMGPMVEGRGDGPDVSGTAGGERTAEGVDDGYTTS
jgi:hypothetical protein